MKNKIRFEDLTHLILLFLLFLSFTTIFLSMESNEIKENLEFCGVIENGKKIENTLDVDKGKSLFKSNCGSCHASDMASDLTGPALGGVHERWKGREEGLYDWIRNSGSYLAKNPDDTYANDLYKKWGVAMTAYPNLKDEEIENILSYIEAVYTQ